MKENWAITIVGNSVVLVPYRKRFVLPYHQWMLDPVLLETTASEPLSLSEEYTMQNSWHHDPKKVTFIVLSKHQLEPSTPGASERELESMAGDVNLFLNDPDDPGNAEIEIMIAEPRFRRNGFAREALKLMISYGVQQLQLKRFFAKIGENNHASLELFKSLQFEEVAYVKAFGEYELEFLPGRDTESIALVQQYSELGLIGTYSNNEDDEED